MITIAMTAGELWLKDAMVTQLTKACWAALAIAHRKVELEDNFL